MFALTNRAFVFLKMGRFREAIADFDSALRINSQQAESLFGRGIARRRLGDVTAGDADIAASLKINPNLRTGVDRLGATP